MTNELRQLSTYIRESDPIYQAIMTEAKSKAVSVSKVLYWALMAYFKDQAALAVAVASAEPVGIHRGTEGGA
jgi:hypothetical protein